MSEPFVAEIRIFAGNFAPRGWAFCDGQLLPISQNTALFSLIGTTYGGDGRSTTQLPNLQGRAPMHPGRGPGLTPRTLGEKGGTESVTLTEQQIASHNHGMRADPRPAVENDAADLYWARVSNLWADSPTAGQTMNAAALEPAGGSQAHDNLQPYLTLSFIIALVGLYPSRS